MNKNVNASMFLDAVLKLKSKGDFNVFAEHVARDKPTTFINLVNTMVRSVRIVYCRPGTNKIRDIKLWRILTNEGLAESKKAIESGYQVLKLNPRLNDFNDKIGYYGEVFSREEAETIIERIKKLWKEEIGYGEQMMALELEPVD